MEKQKRKSSKTKQSNKTKHKMVLKNVRKKSQQQLNEEQNNKL